MSKILSGQTKIRGEKVVKSDKCMGDSQLLGACARAAPKFTPMDRSRDPKSRKLGVKLSHEGEVKSLSSHVILRVKS